MLWVKSPAAHGYATALLQAVESSLKLETTNVFKIPFAVNITQIGNGAPAYQKQVLIIKANLGGTVQTRNRHTHGSTLKVNRFGNVTSSPNKLQLAFRRVGAK